MSSLSPRKSIPTPTRKRRNAVGNQSPNPFRPPRPPQPSTSTPAFTRPWKSSRSSPTHRSKWSPTRSRAQPQPTSRGRLSHRTSHGRSRTGATHRRYGGTSPSSKVNKINSCRCGHPITLTIWSASTSSESLMFLNSHSFQLRSSISRTLLMLPLRLPSVCRPTSLTV